MRINPEDFFDQIGATTEHQLNLKKSMAGYIDHDFDPATYPSEWPRVLLDGQGLSARTYPCLSSYHPIPGDRVLLEPFGSGHVIIGAVQEVPDRQLLPGTLVFQANHSLGTSIANSTTTPIIWNNVNLDLLGGWVGDTGFDGGDFRNQYRPTIPGWYRLDGTVSYATSATGWRSAAWYLNGAAMDRGWYRVTASGTTGTVQAHARSISVELNGINDYVQLWTSQNSGGALSLTSGTPDTHSHIEIVYMGPGSLTDPLPSVE